MKNYYEIRGDVTEIHIEKYGLITLIDTINLEKVLTLSGTNWTAHVTPAIKCTYVETSNKGISYKLHRFLMDCPKDMVVDHINHNTLDNRMCNLRVVTKIENAKNRGKFHYDWHDILREKLLEKERNKPEKETAYLVNGKLHYRKNA